MAGEARKALRFLFRFAELAAQRYALDDALGALRQARAVVDTLVPGERDHAALDAALRQAFVLSLLGRQREVSEVLRSHAAHVERVDDVALVAEYHFRDGMTHFYLGEQVEAYAAAERALAHGERSGDPERIGKALHV